MRKNVNCILDNKYYQVLNSFMYYTRCLCSKLDYIGIYIIYVIYVIYLYNIQYTYWSYTLILIPIPMQYIN